jgi:cell division protein ZapA
MSPRSRRPRHTVTVTIGGEKHILRSDAPPEYTRAVAEHVDKTVKALGKAQPLETHRVAVLAALFITDELFRARKELEDLREELARRADRLGERLEEAVRSAALPFANLAYPLPEAPEAEAESPSIVVAPEIDGDVQEPVAQEAAAQDETPPRAG